MTSTKMLDLTGVFPTAPSINPTSKHNNKFNNITYALKNPLDSHAPLCLPSQPPSRASTTAPGLRLACASHTCDSWSIDDMHVKFAISRRSRELLAQVSQPLKRLSDLHYPWVEGFQLISPNFVQGPLNNLLLVNDYDNQLAPMYSRFKGVQSKSLLE